MTAGQQHAEPRCRVKPVWIVVSLAVLLLAVGSVVALVVFQGRRQQELIQLVEQHGGHIFWAPWSKGELPTPLPLFHSPSSITLVKLNGPGLRQISRASQRLLDRGDELISLRFERCSFAGDDFAALPELPALRYLELIDMQVDTETISQLDRFPDLVSLDLESSQISDQLLARLPLLPELWFLSLYKTRVRGPGLTSLPQQPNLAILRLSNTEVTSQGIAALAGCAKLESLDLANTPIDDGAVEYLLQLPALRELSVADTRLTEEGLRRLEGKFPGLRIPVE